MQISKLWPSSEYKSEKKTFSRWTHNTQLKLALLEEALFRLANYTELTLGETEKNYKKTNFK